VAIAMVVMVGFHHAHGFTIPSQSFSAGKTPPIVERVASPDLEAGWNRLRDLAAVAPGLDRAPLVELEGTLEQASAQSRPLAEGGGRVGEWFLRLADGTTVVCAVEDPPDPAPATGARVTLLGCPWGTLEATGRDGVRRSWPLHVSVFGGVVPAPSGGRWWPLMMGTVLVLLVVWTVLVARIRRSRRTTSRGGGGISPKEKGSTDLPDDPAEAMSVLAGRHADGPASDETESS
jgi:hypothetical protein